MAHSATSQGDVAKKEYADNSWSREGIIYANPKTMHPHNYRGKIKAVLSIEIERSNILELDPHYTLSSETSSRHSANGHYPLLCHSDDQYE